MTFWRHLRTRCRRCCRSRIIVFTWATRWTRRPTTNCYYRSKCYWKPLSSRRVTSSRLIVNLSSRWWVWSSSVRSMWREINRLTIRLIGRRKRLPIGRNSWRSWKRRLSRIGFIVMILPMGVGGRWWFIVVIGLSYRMWMLLWIIITANPMSTCPPSPTPRTSTPPPATSPSPSSPRTSPSSTTLPHDRN